MKLAMGVAASIITPTEMITAAAMIGMASVMPMAVRIESIEKTMLSSMICTIAEAKLVETGCFLSSMSSLGTGSREWWISLVAFHTRNRPPAMRMMSRQEK